MPPKIRIKKKVLSTPKEQFKELLQGKFNEIYNTIHDEFGINQNTKITSQLENIKSRVEEEFFKKINIPDLVTNGVNSFQYKFSQKCAPNQLGKVHSSHTITNNTNFSDLMLFRKHNPIESNILKAIHYNKTPDEYATEEKRFLDHFKSNIKTDFNLTHSDFTNFQNKNDRDNKEVLGNILNTISEFYNINYIIYSPTQNKLHSLQNKSIGNWFVTDQIKANLNKHNLCMLFIIVINNRVIFEPIILIDVLKKTINNTVILNDNEQSGNNKVHQHLVGLIQNKSIKILEKTNIKQKIQENNMKIDNTTEVYFNPYDKNVKLPIIELTLSGNNKQEFLIGSQYGSYRNIYTKIGNNLAGKVKLQEANQKLDVYWCEGYPK